MEFRILGPLQIRGDHGQSCRVGPVHARIVAVLLLSASQVVNWSHLIDAVWSDEPPATARRQVQNAISALRRQLRAAGSTGHIVTAGHAGYQIHVGDGQLDADVYLHQAARAHAMASHGRTDQAVAGFRAALGLWRGPALSGLDGGTLRAAAARLDEHRLTTIEQCLRLELALGRHESVLGELVELAGQHPLRERLVGQLMLALHRCGRQAEALHAYERLRGRLAEDLGIDPGADLQRQFTAILRNEADLPEPVPPDAATRIRDVPRQLPSPIRHFVGRLAELKELTGLLDETPAGPPGIAVISGMGGVGKTALAIHWANQVADRFPDGQLYVNLRGFDPDAAPPPPATTIRTFLEAIGTPAHRIPSDVEAMTALLRSRLTDRRMLIVLDNARDAEQIRPLVPGTPGCLVLVTSRSRLTGLLVAEDASWLSLDLLSSAEAHELLAGRVGAERVAVEPAAAGEIIDLCARLPLALSITAARAVTRPRLALADLAMELCGADGRLDAFDTGDVATELRAVFSWSYRQLSPPAARLFRLIGIHPGPDTNAAAAASLAGITLAAAQRTLRELTQAHLATEHLAGRYALHDLVHAYACELTNISDTDDERRMAMVRMLDHYLYTANAASRLFGARQAITLPELTFGVTVHSITDHRQALEWFNGEHAVLRAVVTHAAVAGFDRHTWQIAHALNAFLHRQGHWQDYIAIQHTALEAAQRLGDQHRQAHIRRCLGYGYTQTRLFADARTQLLAALKLSQGNGDLIEQGRVHTNLCTLHHAENNLAASIGHARQAFDSFRAGGDQAGQASALHAIGSTHALLGEYEQALTYCQQALTLLRAAGNSYHEAGTLDSIAFVHQQLGNHRQAVACFRQAIGLFQELGDRYHTAVCLDRLGDAHQTAGEAGNARAAWEQALPILIQLDHPDADNLRRKLSQA